MFHQVRSRTGMGTALAVLASFFLAACLPADGGDYEDLARTLTSDTVRAEVQQAADLTLAHDAAALQPLFLPGIVGPDFAERIQPMWQQIPPGAALERSLAGVHVNSTVQSGQPDFKDYAFVYQYRMEGGWMLMRIILRESEGRRGLVHLSITPLPGDLRVLNRVDMDTATPGRVAFLVLMAANILFILVTATLIVRGRKEMQYPWRWFFFSLFGLASVTLDWSAGTYTASMLHISLLGAGVANAGPFSPWVFSLSVPLGALMYWWHRLRGDLVA
ncbi:MAG: hypothetical protein EP335_09495 [Alphaproteobacteria bacterium]|nr:MAG: hypothetical protein EP335_09495 [Alphaproteobacteria bacterium]